MRLFLEVTFPNNPPIYTPPLPFSQRFRKAKLDEQFSKFLNIFKKLEVNIPFADSLAQIPNYVKFMKEIKQGINSILSYDFSMLRIWHVATFPCRDVFLTRINNVMMLGLNVTLLLGLDGQCRDVRNECCDIAGFYSFENHIKIPTLGILISSKLFLLHNNHP